MNPDDKTMTYQYHLEKYGANFLYDDFISNLTMENWNPREWVNLIEDAGARYFVPTTKHHDGFALFNMPSNVSNRNSVKQVPHRDVIKVSFVILQNEWVLYENTRNSPVQFIGAI
jgi:alpha-L-fucosidase